VFNITETEDGNKQHEQVKQLHQDDHFLSISEGSKCVMSPGVWSF